MVDLTTRYLGFKLRNPLVVAASPLSEEIENLQRMEEAGAAAIVLHSLFEEQIELQNLGFERPPADRSELLPETLRHIPDMKGYNRGASGYLVHIYRAKKAVDIPIIGSLNGYYSGGWIQYARLIEAAGADAIELNVYYAATKSQVDSAEVEQMHLDLLHGIKETVEIPVALKLSPYFSAMANLAHRLDNTGVDALVLFNRFLQPDIDLETQTVIPRLTLSDSSELGLRLRWVGVLFNQIRADLAITGGVHTAEDVLKGIMAGAKVTMMASALLQNGIEHLGVVLKNLQQWLERHDYDSIQELQGHLSHRQVADPTIFERANYLNVLKNYGEERQARDDTTNEPSST